MPLIEIIPPTIAEQKQERRTKKKWVDLGADYLDKKKENKNYTIKQWSAENNINYGTVRKAFSRFKEDIKTEHKARNPNKTKRDWVDIGVAWRDAKERGISFKEFAKDLDLNYETARRALTRYKKEIDQAHQLQVAKSKKKKLNKRERYLQLLADFRREHRKITKLGKVRAEKRSTKWFNDVIKENVRTKSTSVGGMKPGMLYAYVYDAKWKDYLPFWDMHPLIIYLGKRKSDAGNTLLSGLNLHYIPPKMRTMLLEELLKYASTDRITRNTKLKINWNTVKGFNAHIAKLMIKSYLPNHIKTSIKEIHPADWPVAINLPTQKFVSTSDKKNYPSTKVWSKARNG